MSKFTEKKQRIAKVIAASGLCSRRDAESIILEGRVTVNLMAISSPAMVVSTDDIVMVDGKVIKNRPRPRLWLYNKPAGLVTTHKDESGRDTVFENLPKNMPRVISVGRLDLNSEGLLLLTNDGELARKLEHPNNQFRRVYWIRIKGELRNNDIAELAEGIEVDGIRYAPVKVEPENRDREGSNTWLCITLTEGKNREIRKLMEHFGCRVNRLIRVSYGPYALGDLQPGELMEVPYDDANNQRR